MTSTTRTINIGELAVKIRSADLASAELDTAIASDFEVEVEFTYTAGYPAVLSGPMDDADPGAPDEVEIRHILTEANVHFEGELGSLIVRRGVDLLPLFSNREVTAMEDRLIEMVRTGE